VPVRATTAPRDSACAGDARAVAGRSERVTAIARREMFTMVFLRSGTRGSRSISTVNDAVGRGRLQRRCAYLGGASYQGFAQPWSAVRLWRAWTVWRSIWVGEQSWCGEVGHRGLPGEVRRGWQDSRCFQLGEGGRNGAMGRRGRRRSQGCRRDLPHRDGHGLQPE